MMALDSDHTILEWQSEEFFIPYSNPKTGRFSRYFPDFLVKKRNKDGTIDTIVYEIKPSAQCIPPKKKPKAEKRYINEVATYVTNLSKWESAERYCAKRGWTFQVLTEKELKVF
jgi:TnsA endonuclease N terminal